MYIYIYLFYLFIYMYVSIYIYIYIYISYILYILYIYITGGGGGGKRPPEALGERPRGPDERTSPSMLGSSPTMACTLWSGMGLEGRSVEGWCGKGRAMGQEGEWWWWGGGGAKTQQEEKHY